MNISQMGTQKTITIYLKSNSLTSPGSWVARMYVQCTGEAVMTLTSVRSRMLGLAWGRPSSSLMGWASSGGRAGSTGCGW